jgi:hypothetical protein
MKMRKIAQLTLPILLVCSLAQASERRLSGSFELEAVRGEVLAQLTAVAPQLEPATAAVLFFQAETAAHVSQLMVLTEQLETLNQDLGNGGTLDQNGRLRLSYQLGGLPSVENDLTTLGTSATKKPRKFKLSRGAFLPSPNGF